MDGIENLSTCEEQYVVLRDTVIPRCDEYDVNSAECALSAFPHVKDVTQNSAPIPVTVLKGIHAAREDKRPCCQTTCPLEGLSDTLLRSGIAPALSRHYTPSKSSDNETSGFDARHSSRSKSIDSMCPSRAMWQVPMNGSSSVPAS